MGEAHRRAASAFAPASIGNVAAGFDVLGLAVHPVEGELWGDTVTVTPSARGVTSLTVSGPFAAELPADPADNLALRCHGLFTARLAATGGGLPSVDLHLRKGLPLCSGLGSSSATVVATLVALNRFCADVFTERELLTLCGEGEGIYSGAPHLDNAAPALLGGLQLVDPFGGSAPVPWPEGWRLALVHPDLKVATADARAVLPPAIPLKEAVGYWQNLGALLGALHRGDEALAARCLRDGLIEPHRAPLVRGFDDARVAALDAGAFAFSLSGSGPSVFAVCASPEEAAGAAEGMIEAFEGRGVGAQGGVFVAGGGALSYPL